MSNRDLEMRFELLGGVKLVETWGYNHKITGKEVTYYLPTLHHGDYETILARISIPENERRGTQALIRLLRCHDSAIRDYRGRKPDIYTE